MQKILPNNFKLEKQVIGELMFEGDIKKIKKNIMRLESDDFFYALTKEIFLAIRSIVIQNILPDSIAVMQMLPNSCELIIDCGDMTVTTSNVDQHIHLLQDLHVRRKILLNYDDESAKLIDCDNNTAEIIERLSFNLKTLKTGSKYKQPVETKETIRNVVQKVQDARDSKAGDISVPFCLECVDFKLKLLRKQMHVLAGTPGTGKTAFALSCMVRQILQGYRVVYFCGESSSDEVMIRLAIILAEIEFMDVVTGLKNNSADEIRAFHSAMSQLNAHADNFFVFGKGDYEHGVQDIEYIMDEISSRNRMDAAYFDHLHNMRAPKHLIKESRLVQVDHNVREINNIIGNYDIAGNLLCQLNREAQNVNQPNMSHLKNSSTIEEEAHAITFLSTVNKQSSDEPIREIRWYSDKTRVQDEIYASLAMQKKNMEFVGFFHKY